MVIDPCAGSGTTLRAALELGRNSYGFEINKDFYRQAKEKMLNLDYVDKEKLGENQMTLFDMIGDGNA